MAATSRKSGKSPARWEAVPPEDEVDSLARSMEGWTSAGILAALLRSLFGEARRPGPQDIARLILCARSIYDASVPERSGRPSVAGHVELMALEEDCLSRWLEAELGEAGLTLRDVPPRYLDASPSAFLSPSVGLTLTRLRSLAKDRLADGSPTPEARDARDTLARFADRMIPPRPSKARTASTAVELTRLIFLPAAKRILAAAAHVRVRPAKTGGETELTPLQDARKRVRAILEARPETRRHFPIDPLVNLVSSYRFERRKRGRFSMNDFALDLYYLARKKARPKGETFETLRAQAKEGRRSGRTRTPAVKR